MKLNRILFGCIIIMFAACIVLSGMLLAQSFPSENDPQDVLLDVPTTGATAAPTEEATTENREDTEPAFQTDTITVAIFPNLPDLDLAQNILAAMWEEIEPDIDLEFIYWNCYSDPYPQGIDVISFDALFMDYLVENDLIQPLDLESVGNLDGILPFAMEGARYNGDLYGLPFLACSYFLIHYKEDTDMAQVQNFGELYEELAMRQEWYASDGLQISYSDYASTMYLDALIDYTGTYTTFDEIPPVTPPEEAVLERLLEIESLTPERADYIYGRDFRTRFAQGEGSACYSYSEAMYFMQDIIDQLTIRPLSFFEGENVLMYFADIASIGSHVTDPAKKEACAKLINLLASTEYQAQLCFGAGDVQYLLPAREQVYLAAMEQYPMYETLYILATDENNRIFRFGSEIYDYFDMSYSVLG